MLMEIRAIHNDEDYDWSIKQIEPYFDNEPEPGTADSDRFDVLASLIESYEAKRFSIPSADPVQVIQFAMDKLGRTQSDLARILGSRPRASEILSRKRRLNLQMIRALSLEWHIPMETLAQPYELA